MKIRFGEIPADGLRIEIRDEAWFPDRELDRSGHVYAVVTLKRKGDERVLLTGGIKTAIGFECDRCLEEYSMDVDESFSLDLEYAPGSRTEPAEHEVSPAEMDVLYLQAPVIDLFEILKQQIFLMVPDKHLCAESCKGLCPVCGTNRNEKSCDCRHENKASPFDVLKNMKS
jgi:uncharacterized protein